jgi:hypothetical protein
MAVSAAGSQPIAPMASKINFARPSNCNVLGFVVITKEYIGAISIFLRAAGNFHAISRRTLHGNASPGVAPELPDHYAGPAPDALPGSAIFAARRRRKRFTEEPSSASYLPEQIRNRLNDPRNKQRRPWRPLPDLAGASPKPDPAAVRYAWVRPKYNSSPFESLLLFGKSRLGESFVYTGCPIPRRP